MQTELLINGKLTAGGKVEDVLNPATGKVLARVAEASREQVNAAAARRLRWRHGCSTAARGSTHTSCS